ncbi:GMC family oxidoreductase N-terminal domain-containing protein [Nocardioides convexus]|uniref:GMC family oxidoreductase N-terminal domain-containing protein n=1 Tax=Nocardioides convexus TaxID=2712224 RepID=UPI0024187C7E|nr:GMC family oxidoreductase N-terminal domain-containing protein [Nocardioides convexus]
MRVRARAVVVAAGAIQTPALLQRSGLANPNIGRYLRLHPATAVWGRMNEPVDGWVGSMQSRYVDALTDLDGDGYGVLYETAPLTPGFGSGFVNWRGSADFRRRMVGFKHTLGVAVIVRDRDPGGTVRVGRDGEPVVKYQLSPRDTDHLVRGLVGGARIAEAAGADWIASTHHRTVSLRARPDRLDRGLRGRPAGGGRRTGDDGARGTAHHGQRPDGRIGRDLRRRPGRPDLGRPRPVRRRRVLLPHRLRRQPDDLHRVDRAHDRDPVGGAARLEREQVLLQAGGHLRAEDLDATGDHRSGELGDAVRGELAAVGHRGGVPAGLEGDRVAQAQAVGAPGQARRPAPARSGRPRSRPRSRGRASTTRSCTSCRRRRRPTYGSWRRWAGPTPRCS